MTVSQELHPLVGLMRRYAFGYTAAHDFSHLPSLMVEDYLLRMGPHLVEGRDGPYRAATQRQYDQYPGLGFSVHQVVTNGERIALRFSEHGRSPARGSAVWGGISMYRWDGSRLTECVVEQDYHSRRRQLREGPNPVEAPALDPWTEGPQAADREAESVVRAALGSAALLELPGVVLDDEWCAPSGRVSFMGPLEVDDLWSAGSSVVFHFSAQIAPDRPEAVLHAAGIAEVHSGQILSARVVTGRHEVLGR
jgi:hypothetical protein